MATEIKQIDLADRRTTILRVEGEMFGDDAELVARLVRSIRTEDAFGVVIDLADLDFIDSEAASILKALEDMGGVEIEGIEIFLQSAIDMAERA